MLAELEGKLAAVVGDALAARTDVAITRAVGEPPAPAAGKGAVAVGLSTLAPEPVFAEETVLVQMNGAAATRRRLLPVKFGAMLAFARSASAETPTALAQARGLLLEDASVVAYALGEITFATGEGFVPAAPDPGFAVRAFGLASAALDAPRAGPVLRGTLAYAGIATIWPAGLSEPEGIIGAVDALTEALPLTIAPDDPVVSVGGSTTVRIRSVTGRRLAAGGGRTAPQLALYVVSDLPPAERGAIASGVAGTETGLRIVPAAAPETTVAYQAPTGDLGATRTERVAVHLARADGTKGLFLGSTAILLAPGGP
jgi:hypothetical protein